MSINSTGYAGDEGRFIYVINDADVVTSVGIEPDEEMASEAHTVIRCLKDRVEIVRQRNE